jgi:hypothetical protein
MQQAPPDHANMSHKTQLPVAFCGNSNFRGTCGRAAPMAGQQEPHAAPSGEHVKDEAAPTVGGVLS